MNIWFTFHPRPAALDLTDHRSDPVRSFSRMRAPSSRWVISLRENQIRRFHLIAFMQPFARRCVHADSRNHDRLCRGRKLYFLDRDCEPASSSPRWPSFSPRIENLPKSMILQTAAEAVGRNFHQVQSFFFGSANRIAPHPVRPGLRHSSLITRTFRYAKYVRLILTAGSRRLSGRGPRPLKPVAMQHLLCCVSGFLVFRPQVS